jgi:hypothetical protein
VNENERLRAYLQNRLPDHDWAYPRSVYSPGSLVVGKDGCGERGTRTFTPGTACASIFTPHYCGSCPPCLDFADNQILFSLCKLMEPATEPVYFESFDLEGRTEPNFLSLPWDDLAYHEDDIFLDEIYRGLLPEIHLGFGHRLTSRREIDRLAERRREQIRYANSKGGREGGLLLMTETLRSAAVAPLPSRDDGQNLERGKFLIILSSMRYAPRRSTQPLMEPAATFTLPPDQVVPYMRRVLDVGREPIFNPSSDEHEAGKVTRVRWWGSWEKLTRETDGRYGVNLQSISGLTMAFWPKVEEKFPGSPFEQALRSVFNQTLPVKSIEAEDLVKAYRDLLIVLFLWREAAAVYRGHVLRPVFGRDSRFWESEAKIVEAAVERLQDEVVTARQDANLALIEEGREPIDWRADLNQHLKPVNGVMVLI